MSQTDAKNEAPWLLVVGILSISLWCEVRELSHLTENTFVSLRGEFDRFAAFQQEMGHFSSLLSTVITHQWVDL